MRVIFIFQYPGNNCWSKALNSGFVRLVFFSRARSGSQWPPADMELKALTPPQAHLGPLLYAGAASLEVPPSVAFLFSPLQCPPHLPSVCVQDVDHTSLSCPLHLSLPYNPSSTLDPICSLSAQQSSDFSSGSILWCVV